MLLAFILCLLTAVALQEIDIHTKNVISGQNQELGILFYDASLREASFSAISDTFPESGAFSICARDPDSCFAYQEIKEKSGQSLGGEFLITINESGTIQSLSFSRGTEPNVYAAKVSVLAEAPKPNLNPYNKRSEQEKQQVQTQKVIVKKLVENEKGEKIEVEEEVEEVVEADNRSWVQKNWMYIVPPLVLFLIFSPEDKK
ncbi:hypothetical protein METSCH_D06640 [Metschnikowia aff. pulcherrima]|uniref:ER membrane protein complex subunit 10 n=1 Tax=Metschnikowia aff. pulcherrima TaxID=2163413 RepID=A0A4P6XT51_9ASCO|nr:hypothetical protein METSCH_D06640 [Metschnikowia aff. pulcherrima]